MKKLSIKYKPISETDYLSDSQLASIEAGSCDAACKKSCMPGNQNANIGNGNGTASGNLEHLQTNTNNNQALIQ